MIEKWKIVNAVGGILIVIGIWFALGAAVLDSDSQTKTVDINPGYYYAIYTTSSMSGASVSGSFSASPGAVDFFVYTNEQYEYFDTHGFSSDYIYSDSGNAGAFSVALPGTGTYYMVALNADPTSTVAQEYTITFVLKGLAWTPLIMGIMIIAAGAVLSIYGLKLKAKAARDLEELATPIVTGIKEGNDSVKLSGENPPAPPPDGTAAKPPIAKTRTVRRPPQTPT